MKEGGIVKLTGAYQEINIYLDENVTKAVEQALATNGSIAEISLKNINEGGILTISTIISPDYLKSIKDYKDTILAVDADPSQQSLATVLGDDAEFEDYDWEIELGCTDD